MSILAYYFILIVEFIETPLKGMRNAQGRGEKIRAGGEYPAPLNS